MTSLALMGNQSDLSTALAQDWGVARQLLPHTPASIAPVGNAENAASEKAVSDQRKEPVHTDAILIAAILLAAVTEAMASTVLSLGRADIIGDTYATPDQFAWLDIGYTTLKMMGFISASWFITRIHPHRLGVLTTLAMGTWCAFAAFTRDLETLIVLRGLQGFSGGILLVSGQTLLFLVNDRTRQPIIQALFAIGSVVAPATIAPALQGWFLDNQSWTWIFLANVPIAAMAVGLLLIAKEPSVTPLPKHAFDWLGFTLLSLALAALTYIFNQGSRWDWFDESRIIWLTGVAVVAFLVFVAWEIVVRGRTLLEFSAFRTEDFAFAFVVSFVAGAALFGSAYIIPSFAVSVLAFTPTDAGLLLLPSGALFIASLLVAGSLMQMWRMPPIVSVPFGIGMIMIAMWMLSGSNSQSGSDDMMPAVLLRGLGLGFLFLPMQIIAYTELPRHALASGIALFNVGRQLGGLIGVAGLETLVDHQTIANQSALAAHVRAGIPAVSDRIAEMTSMLASRGMEAAAAGKAAVALLDHAVAGQSTVIAFNMAFGAIALLFVVAVPFFLIPIKIILHFVTARRARRSGA